MNFNVLKTIDHSSLAKSGSMKTLQLHGNVLINTLARILDG